MHELLENELNLQLLQYIVAGDGVEINVSEIAKKLNKHRNTIKDRINDIYKHNIINKPQYPFPWLYTEYPLMAISRFNFNRDEKTRQFIELNDHIFAAFFFKEDEYNTLMISFHKNVCAHQQWNEHIIKNEIIPKKEEGYPTEVLYLGTGCFVKHNPSITIKVVENNIQNKRQTHLRDLPLDTLTLKILKMLLRGEGIRTNEHYLAQELNVHRKTIERHIHQLKQANIIRRPVCFFPRVIAPPQYILVKSLFQIKKQQDIVLKHLKEDPHISWLIKAVTGRGGYNLVLFSSFYRIEDHLNWQEQLDQHFPNCIGAIKDTYLSPSMTFSIDPEYVSLRIIKNKLTQIKKSTPIN